MAKKDRDSKLTIGWYEWCGLPTFHIPAIKAKVDTGAKTSALHAENMKLTTVRGKEIIHFTIYPLQNNQRVAFRCKAPLIDQRHVLSSSGHREERYVIASLIRLGSCLWNIELTLSNREPLAFRMLLGRQALKPYFVIDPSRAQHQGKLTKPQLRAIYPELSGSR